MRYLNIILIFCTAIICSCSQQMENPPSGKAEETEGNKTPAMLRNQKCTDGEFIETNDSVFRENYRASREKKVNFETPTGDSDTATDLVGDNFTSWPNKSTGNDETTDLEPGVFPPSPKNYSAVKSAVMKEVNSLGSHVVAGTVVYEIEVDATGKMLKYSLVKTPHPMLSKIVEKHLPELTWTPATSGGKAVKATTKIPFHITLN